MRCSVCPVKARAAPAACLIDRTRSYRLTRKYSSKNSFEFKDEAGENANSMSVMTEGKGTRVSPSGSVARN